MIINIALAGNPNCGKTSMFNFLTGSAQYVGNWPGVTVEKKAGKLKGHQTVEIVDLPGIYSLSPYTQEEVVARNYLLDERPQVILNIIDATNLERNLYLTSQLAELGLPMVVALNMSDLLRKRGYTIDVDKLQQRLGCPVVETSASTGVGCLEAAELALTLVQGKIRLPLVTFFTPLVEDALEIIERAIADQVPSELTRWYAIKVFERDKCVAKRLRIEPQRQTQINALIERCENELDDDSPSIITNERYSRLTDLAEECLDKHNAPPLTLSEKIDQVVTSKVWAFPIFAGVMFLVYFVAVSTVGSWGTTWVNEVLFGQIILPAAEQFLMAIGSAPWLISMVVDGALSGVGAVLGFVPQILVLFFLLSILEDCGYMARIAFIMDRIFHKFGLSGKSFIPILIGTGCGVPAIMAARTIENESDRKITIMTATFIPCSAKLPIIALIVGALFPGSIWVAPSAYFLGIIAILLSGVILKKSRGLRGVGAPFVMELPVYHLPIAKNVLTHTWERGRSFIIKAGTIIFICCVAIWFLSSFNWSLQMVTAESSILASIGRGLAIIFAPVGWGNWQAVTATLTGLVAKENIVGTLGVLYGFGEASGAGWNSLQAAFSPLAGYSFLAFNLLCAPCFAAIAAIRREMGGIKWTWFALLYQTGFAYAIAFLIYQLGLLLLGNGFTILTIIAVIILFLLVYFAVRPVKGMNDLSTMKEGISWQR